MNTSLDYKIQFIDPHFIKVVASGTGDSNHIADMYQDIVGHAKSFRCDNILFDSSNFQGKYPLIELLPLVRRVKPSLLGFKMARICNTLEHRQGFIETVVQKENLNIKNFNLEADALDWLIGTNK